MEVDKSKTGAVVMDGGRQGQVRAVVMAEVDRLEADMTLPSAPLEVWCFLFPPYLDSNEVEQSLLLQHIEAHFIQGDMEAASITKESI